MLHDLFSLVCGARPDHTFHVAGEALPLCQRCLGIYAGAASAIALGALVAPPRGRLALAVHALLALQIAPAGLGLYPQGPIVRAVTGGAFALGVVYLLALPLRAERPAAATGTHAAASAATLAALALAAATQPPPALRALVWLAAAGSIALAGLALASLARSVAILVRPASPAAASPQR